MSNKGKKPNKGHENLIPAKKGEVRNPKGKPKGTLNSKTILNKYLSQKDKDSPEGRTVFEETMLKLIAKARKGDLAALNILLDRSEGKAVQRNVNENIETSYEDYLESLKDKE